MIVSPSIKDKNVYYKDGYFYDCEDNSLYVPDTKCPECKSTDIKMFILKSNRPQVCIEGDLIWDFFCNLKCNKCLKSTEGFVG